MSLYRYFAMVWGGRRRTVSLLAARDLGGGGHIAAWFGVGDPDAWVQGGVEMSDGDTHPWTYFERNVKGGAYKLRLWETQLGKTHTIRVRPRRGGGWNVWVDQRGPFHGPAGGRPNSMLEVMGHAHGRALIGGRQVSA